MSNAINQLRNQILAEAVISNNDLQFGCLKIVVIISVGWIRDVPFANIIRGNRE